MNTSASEIGKQARTELLKRLRALTEMDNMPDPHVLILYGHPVTDKADLACRNERGWTTAHLMALMGHRFEDKDILELRDNNGTTVLSLQSHCHKPGGVVWRNES